MSTDVLLFTMTIAGKAAPSFRCFPVINPATEESIAFAPDALREQLDDAVAAARDAFPSWAATPLAERQSVIAAIAQVYLDNVDELGHLLMCEQGKPLAAARAEVSSSAYWLFEVAKMVIPIEVLQDDAQALVTVRHTPLGVVGGMVPWNYPVMLAAWKIGPALLAGNTMVLKPSPFTPLVTLRLGELLRDVVPPGVFNVVSGGDMLGPWMSAHTDIDKIAFTGSTPTGRKVMESASVNLKRLTLELGGNDAAIVMPDVDVDAVATELFWGALINSGQICVAAKRIYVHKTIYNRMAKAFVELAKKTPMGPGDQDGVKLGPVQNRLQFDRLKALLDDCKENGYRFLTGGEVPPGLGYFFPVTLVDNPPDDARVVIEEPFGPILPLLEFSDIDEVIARSNTSEYGLAGSVWCKDEQLALSIAERMQTGTVWINRIHDLSPHRPFAGHKQSGLGVENGVNGLLEYTVPQTVSMRRTF